MIKFVEYLLSHYKINNREMLDILFYEMNKKKPTIYKLDTRLTVFISYEYMLRWLSYQMLQPSPSRRLFQYFYATI